MREAHTLYILSFIIGMQAQKGSLMESFSLSILRFI